MSLRRSAHLWAVSGVSKAQVIERLRSGGTLGDAHAGVLDVVEDVKEVGDLLVVALT
jgi:hypothetical protein